MQRLIALALFCGAGLWNWSWEFIRSLIYERAFHMLTPFIDSASLDQVLRWGPSLIFAGIGAFLFWKTRPIKTAPIAESLASNEFLPLYEAARRLIDENIGGYDAAARKLSISDEVPIPWWCYWVKGKTKIYGKFIPARVLLELLDISYDFKVEGENVVAVQRSGRDKWEEISILTSEFPKLLRQAKEGIGL